MVQTTERTALTYENLSQRFIQKSTNYNKQYCSIYLQRLIQMTKLLEEQIKKKWNNQYPICKLHKLSSEDQETHSKYVVIGTLFKNQKLKPSILKQLADGCNLEPQPLLTIFTDNSDELFIEDELQRYQVIGGPESKNLVTGISCALLGTDGGHGKFIIEDYTFANFRPQIQRPLLEDNSYIIFLSGLDLINCKNIAVNLQMLTYWLCGFIGDVADLEASKVVRLVIAGNSVRNIAEVVKPSISMLSRKAEAADTIAAVKVLDELLVQLSKVIDVDVMPGENDPSNHVLPQQPMHHCLFPGASPYKSLNQVSNPYWCEVGGVRIVGSSGQPVRDVLRFSGVGGALDVLEGCLEWSHLAPTAPDTLGCYPFYECDPFVVEECPHVFFAGNQERFETRECTGPEGQKVRLISIPEFSTTLQIGVLNLKNLECTSMSFKTL